MKTFDEIFNEVMDQYDVNNWWDVFDSGFFDEVVKAIAKDRGFYFCEDDDIFDILMDNCEGFKNWYQEMANEL